MSKDYQKEVVEFLKPTSDKMGLTEARSAYGKEISIGAKAEKSLETFVKVISKLKDEANEKKGAERTSEFGKVYEDILDAERAGKIAYDKLRDVMDIFASLDGYRG